MHWVECVETVARTTVTKQESEVSVSRFVHITNVEMARETVCSVSEGGRLRWKIENEGFNTQKNSGYNMDHKYSRVSFQALKNYYQCLQLAHLINDSPGIGYLWQKVLGGFLIWIDLDEGELAAIGEKRWQIRLSD